jgi:hypothetical protein
VVGGEHQAGVLPAVPGREPLAGLGFQQRAERLDRQLREAEGAAGPLGLGLAVGEFSGGEVDFSRPRDWSVPPEFTWTDTPPPGVKLPKEEDQSQAQGSAA